MRSIPRSHLFRMTAAVLLAGTVVACGSNGGGNAGSNGNASGARSSSSLNAMSAAELYPLAKKEGEITLYTSSPVDLLPGLRAAFAKSYPGVKLNALSLSGNTPTTRIETEAKAGSHIADVVSGAGDPSLLAQQGLIDTSFKPEGFTVPEGLKLLPGVFVDSGLTNVIIYNPAKVKAAGLQPPTDYTDFAKPEWKGKFSIDPVTADMLSSLEGTDGRDKVLDLVKQLGNNDPLFVTSHSLSVSQVASGTVLASVSAYGYKSLPASEKDPSNFAFVNPNPLPVSVGASAIVIDAPHPAAARLYLDWELSRVGQQAAVVDAGLGTSFRTDVTGQEKLWDTTKWKPAFNDPSQSAADRNKDLADYRAALHYTG